MKLDLCPRKGGMNIVAYTIRRKIIDPVFHET